MSDQETDAELRARLHDADVARTWELRAIAGAVDRLETGRPRPAIFVELDGIARGCPGVAYAEASFRGPVPGLVTLEAHGSELRDIPDRPGMRETRLRDLTADEKKVLMETISAAVPEDVCFVVVP